jgi:hypothetical protein
MSENDNASTNNPRIPPDEPVFPSSHPLWNNDPRQTFHCLRDWVIDALAIVCEIHGRAQAAPREEPLANHVGELADRLNQAIVAARAIWFDTPAADYLERATPVYLDREGQQTAQGISGSCYHDLALCVASGTLEAIRQGLRVKDYTGKLRGATAAGNFVAGHLASLIPQVRCECQEGIARWRTEARTAAAPYAASLTGMNPAPTPQAPEARCDEDEKDQPITSGDLIPIASDVPDLGTARSVHEFWDWCNRHREGLRQLRVRLGEPPPASIAPDEFRCIPEIVRQCRQHLLGFGASDIPEQFAFATLPTVQAPNGPEYGSSETEAFVSSASGYRIPGHGLLKLVGDVEDCLTWAMSWCQDHRASAEEQAPHPEGSAPPSPPVAEWCFVPSGNGYLIAGFGESGHLSGYKGLADIARLIKTPGVAVPMMELEGAGKQARNDRRTPQPAVDDPGRREIVERLQELRGDLDKAEQENNTVDADVARAEIDQLEASLVSTHGLGGKPRDLNNLYNKLRPKIQGRLRTVYKAMRESDPPMTKLADHFALSISAESGSGFIYRPAADPPPWQFERSEDK